MISEDTLKQAASELIEHSEYVSKHQVLLDDILDRKTWQDEVSFASCLCALKANEGQSLDVFMRSLRVFRHEHLLRLLLRTRLGLSTIEETMRVWSDVADALILTALIYIERSLMLVHGEPRDSRGIPVQLYPIALGKLGGQELNFSSDIDLIFVYGESGQTSGPHVITNEEHYIKVIKKFTYVMQHTSLDGFVFRVDLRLRPFGGSGPLAMSVAATEAYYQEQGRDWERYAMVKARLIGGDALSLIKRSVFPFVYRKYVDFSVIESLRNMKMLIERELLLDPTLDDIKRGRGGIREIEFIIQCFQLIRGGRMPQFQVTGSIAALEAIGQAGLFKWFALLKQAYLFYRTLENGFQSFSDRQTHAMPEDSRARAYLVLMIGEGSYEILDKKKTQYQRLVRRLFCRMLVQKNSHKQEDEHMPVLTQVWKGHIETSMAVNAMKNQGIVHAEACYRLMYAFRHSPKCRRLSQVARLRLDQLMSRFLSSLIQTNPSLSVLESMFELFDEVIHRSVYLALLTENAHALQRVMNWFQKSKLIAQWVVSNPFLLDILISLNDKWRPLTRLELQHALKRHLKHTDDQEAEGELLREFKLMYWLHIACAELAGRCTAIQASRFLSDLAGVIVLAVVDLARAALVGRYPEIDAIQSQFFILAYGKLGSKEMSYDSDLDLVFLHQAIPAQEHLIFRLTQKVLYMLTTRSRAGVLYPTDTRLRPSGSSGLLVSSVSLFTEYQRTHAWIWEHQALLKARVLLGSPQLQRELLGLKKYIFTSILDESHVRHDIHMMRLKIKQHHDFDRGAPQNSIKHCAGGLLDLEFFVQSSILVTPNPVWRRVTHTARQLLHLKALGVITSTECAILISAYQAFHHALHQETFTCHPCIVDVKHHALLQQIISGGSHPQC